MRVNLYIYNLIYLYFPPLTNYQNNFPEHAVLLRKWTGGEIKITEMSN